MTLQLMQVWYSAGRTTAVLHDFHACVESLLNDQEALASQTAEVKEWLQAWQGCTIQLTTARTVWLQRQKHRCGGIADLLRK